MTNYQRKTTIQFVSFMYLMINHTWCAFICICFCLLCD